MKGEEMAGIWCVCCSVQEMPAGRLQMRRDHPGALHTQREEVRRLPGLPERQGRGEMREQHEACLPIGPIQV